LADFERLRRSIVGGNKDTGALRAALEENRDRIDDLLAKLADATAR
jgi:hypothetical protein